MIIPEVSRQNYLPPKTKNWFKVRKIWIILVPSRDNHNFTKIIHGNCYSFWLGKREFYDGLKSQLSPVKPVEIQDKLFTVKAKLRCDVMTTMQNC